MGFRLALLLLAGAAALSTAAPIDPSRAPEAVRKAIAAQSAGRTLVSLERLDAEGDAIYAAVTRSPDGKEWELTVAADGTVRSVEVTLAQLPAPAQAAIKAQLGTDVLDALDRLDDGGQSLYQATATAAGGRSRTFTVAADGSLVSREVTLDALPTVVHTAIVGLVGRGDLEGIEETHDDGQIDYEATFTASGGGKRTATVAADGRIVSREIALAEAPAPVQATLKTLADPAQLGLLLQETDDGASTYETDIDDKGKNRAVTVAEGGTLVSREIGVDELPDPVRATAAKQLGDGGRIVGAAKSFVPFKGVLPYEIEGEKGGQPFNFLVGPKGRFLGMDE